MKRIVLALIATLPMCIPAQAALFTRIDPFSGTYMEGFENTYYGPFKKSEMFEGQAMLVSSLNSTTISVTQAWFYRDSQSGEILDTVTAHTGRQFMGSFRGGVQWLFDTPAAQFGGYFSRLMVPDENSQPRNEETALVEFFDADDNFIGSDTITAPFSGQWTWTGWSFQIPAGRIVVTGNGVAGDLLHEGLVMHDDMQYTPVPEPMTFMLLVVGGVCLRGRR